MCFRRILPASLAVICSPSGRLSGNCFRLICAAVGELLNLFMSDIPDDQLFQYADRVHDTVVIITGIGHLICMIGFLM